MLKPITRAAAVKELQRRAARQNLAAFVTFTTPGYLMGWVHKEICDALDKFLQDILAKKSPRLIITMPPRSGKSELVSRRFPAYVFGRCPDLSFIASSYSSDLAQRFNRDVQRIMSDEAYQSVFPETSLSSGRDGYIKTSDLFEIVNHRGSYRSCGVGGGITGQGCEILCIDDPIKDRADANSETIRNRLWDWYTSTAYTRLAPGGGVIAMLTRWHCDDLIGRLTAHMQAGDGEQWQIVNYPAIAEHDEPHRKEGEALHPERYDEKALARIRKTIGERDWAALYQQHPIPDGGGVFKDSWIQFWTKDTLPKSFDKRVISWDMTFKDTDGSDYVVGQVWGRSGGCFYLIDQVRGRWDFVKTLNAFIEQCNKYPSFTRRLVEDKANGSAIISALKNKIPGLIPITPKESKEARAYAITTLWEAKNVYLPSPDLYPWVKTDFIPELLSFPAGAHDDQVDAMTQALNQMKGSTFKIDPSNLAYLGY